MTLEEGCNGTATVCLKDGTYKPYACGGYYPSEVTWKVKVRNYCICTKGSLVGHGFTK